MTDPRQHDGHATDAAPGPTTDEAAGRTTDEAAGRTTEEAGRPTTVELLDMLRRERADFRNYQRRVADERTADAETARGRLLEPIFPLLDDLQRAIAEIPEQLEEDPWVKGIAMLRSRLEATLAGMGLEPVGRVGEPFDPTRHEAVYHDPDPTAERQVVAAVIRPGYRLGGRLLRPAQVVVRGPLVEGGGGSGTTSTSPSNEDGAPEPVRPGRPDDGTHPGG